MAFRFLIPFLCLIILSCGKKESYNNDDVSDVNLTDDNEDTVQLSPEEEFSFSLTNYFLDIEDEDLQVYLEEEIFPVISGSEKITLDKISSSLYLLSYELQGEKINLLIQKFYDAKKDVIFFDKETVAYDARKQFVK